MAGVLSPSVPELGRLRRNKMRTKMNDRLINETCLSQSLSTDWECYNRLK